MKSANTINIVLPIYVFRSLGKKLNVSLIKLGIEIIKLINFFISLNILLFKNSSNNKILNTFHLPFYAAIIIKITKENIINNVIYLPISEFIKQSYTYLK